MVIWGGVGAVMVARSFDVTDHREWFGGGGGLEIVRQLAGAALFVWSFPFCLLFALQLSLPSCRLKASVVGKLDGPMKICVRQNPYIWLCVL